MATGSVDRLPERLESLVASRIDRLDPRGRRLLRRAAVIGRVVDVDLLAEVVADDGDARDARDLGLWSALDEFVALGTARPSSASAMTSSVTRPMRACPTRDATSCTGASRSTIERRRGDDTDPVAAELATHFAEGELPEPAFRYARRAGDLARALYANVDAAALYRRAMASAALVRDLPPSTVADVAEVPGRRRRARGAVRRGPRRLRRARRRHRQREPLDVAGHADATAGTWHHDDGDAAFHLAGSRGRAGS